MQVDLDDKLHLSLSLGLSEEVFFRGLLFPLFTALSNTPIALIASSLLFGVAHYPFVFGAASALEVFLGAYFTFAYWYSGYNLFVPILIHSFYDATTLFTSWWSASRELNQNLGVIDDNMRTKPYAMSRTDPFKDSCKAVFDMIDVDSNGAIDKTELVLAQQLFT